MIGKINHDADLDDSLSKKVICIGSPASSLHGNYPKRLAETACLSTNHHYGPLQYDGSARGRRSCIDQRRQVFNLSHRPLSASDANHLVQYGLSPFVPKENGLMTQLWNMCEAKLAQTTTSVTLTG
jgi:hypothetical protein